MCRANQHGLVGPNVEPNVGLTTAWEAPCRDAGLVYSANLQIAVFRRELDGQPLIWYRNALGCANGLKRDCVLRGALGECRHAPLENLYLYEGVLALRSLRKLSRGFPKADQQTHQIAQIIGFGHSN